MILNLLLAYSIGPVNAALRTFILNFNIVMFALRIFEEAIKKTPAIHLAQTFSMNTIIPLYFSTTKQNLMILYRKCYKQLTILKSWYMLIKHLYTCNSLKVICSRLCMWFVYLVQTAHMSSFSGS